MKEFLARVSEKFSALALASLLAFSPVAAIAQGFTLPDGSAIQGHVKAMGSVGAAPPTAVGCTIGAGSTDFSGSCVTSAGSGSITFQRTFTAAPSCMVVDSTATPVIVYTVSATAITISATTTAHTLFYTCIGTQAST